VVDVDYHNAWTVEEELFLLARIKEGYDSRACSVLLPGRSPRACTWKARQLGSPFPRSIRRNRSEHHGLNVNLSTDTFRNLEAVARELEIKPGHLARILINIVSQKQYWGLILDLGGMHCGAQSFDGHDPRP
jgi:hypothetical protein